MGLFGCSAEYNTQELEFKKLKSACSVALKGLQNVVKHSHYGDDLRILLSQTANAFKDITEFFEPYLNEETIKELDYENNLKLLQAENENLTQEQSKLEKRVRELQRMNTYHGEELEQAEHKYAQLKETFRTQNQLHDELNHHLRFHQKEIQVLKGLKETQGHAWIQKPYPDLVAFNNVHQQNYVPQKQCQEWEEINHNYDIKKPKKGQLHKSLKECANTQTLQLQQKKLLDEVHLQNNWDGDSHQQKCQGMLEKYSKNYVDLQNQMDNVDITYLDSNEFATGTENYTDFEKFGQKLRHLENAIAYFENHCQNLEKTNFDLCMENEELKHNGVLAQRNVIEHLQSRIEAHTEVITLLSTVNTSLQKNEQLPPHNPITARISANTYTKANETNIDQYQMEMMKFINEIDREINDIAVEIGKSDFSTLKQDYLHMQELVIRCMLQLDNIQSRGNQSVRSQRSLSMKNAQDLLKLLETQCSD